MKDKHEQDYNLQKDYLEYTNSKNKLQLEYRRLLSKALQEPKKVLGRSFKEYLNDYTTQDIIEALGTKNLNFVYECINLAYPSSKATPNINTTNTSTKYTIVGNDIHINGKVFTLPPDGDVPIEWADEDEETLAALIEALENNNE